MYVAGVVNMERSHRMWKEKTHDDDVDTDDWGAVDEADADDAAK